LKRKKGNKSELVTLENKEMHSPKLKN